MSFVESNIYVCDVLVRLSHLKPTFISPHLLVPGPFGFMIQFMTVMSSKGNLTQV